MDKPKSMFDRDREWSAIRRFVTDDQEGATLGVVSGRRRQGKTFLLDAVSRQAGGFFFGATEATEAESLRRLSAELVDRLSLPAYASFGSWHQALDALLDLGRERPIPVIIDEFPYLVKASPELPSIIQSGYGPRRIERLRSQTRLLLCGSAMSFMGRLLSGSAPLRGRAGLELVVRPFDHRLAAEFWDIDDPVLALKVNAIVGGTPAYRREFVRNDTPSGPDDFDDWVIRTVLSPESPLFREARYLLAEEPDLRDTALYSSVLAAIASGDNTRGGIANSIGRKVSDLSHPLDVLEDAGLINREPDAFRANRTRYRIAEPLIEFYYAVMRPVWSQLERPGSAARVWRGTKRRYVANVLGPHFERICREWTLTMAPEDLFEGQILADVSSGIVNDPANKTSWEVDVVAIGLPENSARTPLLAIGEAKWGEEMSMTHVERLRRIKRLVAAGDKYDATNTRLLCFGGAGFTAGLRAAAEADHDVVLIDVSRLYGRE